MEHAPTNPHEHLTDEDLARRIKEVNASIIAITDNPMRGMAAMDLGTDKESNATEGEFEQGQFIPDEQNNDTKLRAELVELNEELARRHKKAA